MFLKLALILSISTAFTTLPEAEAATDKVVCFYASWARYRTGAGAYTPSDINPNLCTHILYAFLGVETDGSLKILDSWSEIELGGLQDVANLKTKNPKLKVMITIGGWNAGSQFLSDIVASPVLRSNLIQSCLSFFQQWNYDGIDVDWEFPDEQDKDNFMTLLEEMHAAFSPKGYILSVTASPYLSTIPYYNEPKSYVVPDIFRAVDFINLVTYNYYLPEWGSTGYNAPLFGVSCVNQSVYSWLKYGADPKKLTISIPLYGHSYTLYDETNFGVGASATFGVAGPYTERPGVLGYNEICSLYDDGFKTVWNTTTQVPYRYKDDNWISYDDEHSVSLKVHYAKVMGLAGVAVWSMDTDDFLGACGTPNILLQTINDNIA